MNGYGLAFLITASALILVSIRCAIHNRQLDNESRRTYPLESDGIPDWVNDGRPLEQRFIEAVDFALWEADHHNEDKDT
jgi:hypothetical protein